MTRPDRAITRYTTLNRVNHWINAGLFILLVLSGLSMFHPILFFLSELFGGGQWARAAHPWFGVSLVISWIGMIIQFWRSNLPSKDDIAWSKAIVHVVKNDDEHVPPIGRNNSGQKLVFWSMTLLIPVLFVTGLLIWEVYFGEATSIPVQRVAVAHVQPIRSQYPRVLSLRSAEWRDDDVLVDDNFPALGHVERDQLTVGGLSDDLGSFDGDH